MTSIPSEVCRDPQRRRMLRTSNLCGIDYIEVSDDRLTLTVFFIGKVSSAISAGNVRITGGVHVRHIRVLSILIRDLDDSEIDNCLEVAIDRPRDRSTYKLSRAEVSQSAAP